MSIYNIGRICVKLAGRDAGQKCVVLSEVKEGKVLVDGATRRREVNTSHLEPLSDIVSVAAGASTAEVSKVLEPLGVKVRETKAKKAGSRPRHVKKVKKGGKAKAAALKTKPVAKETKAAKKTETKAREVKAAPEAKKE